MVGVERDGGGGCGLARDGGGIGIDAPMAAWFFAVPMAKAITLAPISFGGFGLREVTLAGFLEKLAGVQVGGVK